VVNEIVQGSWSWEIEAIYNGILQLSNCINSSSLSMWDRVIITPHMLLLNWFLGALLCLFVLVMFHLAYYASFWRNIRITCTLDRFCREWYALIGFDIRKKKEQINNAGSHNWICFRQKKEKIITRFYQKMNLKQNPFIFSCINTLNKNFQHLKN